jgi:hypothetical protein
MPRQTLGHSTRVDEDEGRPVRLDERGQAIVIFLPHLVRHDGIERRPRDLDAEIHLAAMAFVNDGAGVRVRRVGRPDKKSRDLVDRLLRGRESQAQGRTLGDLPEAFEREREMCPTPCTDHRMDFIDDDRADGAEHLPAALGREQKVERLRGRDQDVGRRAQHGRAFRLRRVAGAHRRGDPGSRESGFLRQAADPAAWLPEVLVDVGAQRLEGRHIQHPHFVREWVIQSFAQQVVERGQEGRERLAGSGGSRNQRMPPLSDRLPAVALRRRRLADLDRKPALSDWMKMRERHRQ